MQGRSPFLEGLPFVLQVMSLSSTNAFMDLHIEWMIISAFPVNNLVEYLLD